MKFVLLLLLPLALLVNVAYNDKTEFGQDPAYIYLFNGLNLASQAGPVGQYDNPGTTVSECSAVIMKIAYTLRKTDNDFATDVLKDPQYYIKYIVRTFVALNCILIFLLGFFILKTTHELSYSLMFQAIPTFSKSVIDWCFQSLCPEPLLLGSVIILMMLFLRKFYFNKSFGNLNLKYSRNKEIVIDKYIILSGLLMGFCLATKINTMTLLLLPLLFIPEYKNKLIFLVVVLISFILFTLPIAHLYVIMAFWYLGISSHTDLYGSGSSGFIDPDLFYRNFLETLKSEPVILFIILISVIVIIKMVIQKKHDIHFKILAALVLVQLADLFIVLKHFSLHYFIPIVPTLAVNLFIILRMFNFSKLLKTVLIVSFVAISFWVNKDIEKFVPGIFDTTYPKNGINVFSSESRSALYALKFGDDFSSNANSDKLNRIYGTQYFYNIWNKVFVTWKDTISLDSLFKANKTVYLHALDLYMKEWPPPFKLKSISRDLYLVTDQKTDSLVVK
jgi:hypothetical protein